MIKARGKKGSVGNLNLDVGVVLMLLACQQMCIKCVSGYTRTPISPSVTLAWSASQHLASTAENTTAENTTAISTDMPSYRLPTSVYPLHYDLELQPYINNTDPSNFTFRGIVKILVRCNNATDTIIVHVDGLTVDNTSITLTPETPSDSGDPKYSSCEEDKARHFFIVRLDKDMEAGKNYWIQMNFTSPLTKSLEGLYYSSSKRDNQTVYIVSTQFQTIYARRAFPCFDEPAMKATFNVTLVRPADRISLSNMPIDHSETPFQEDGTTYVKDVYQRTPIMSAYLLAFVICDYMNLTSKTKNNVTYRTWFKPEDVNATRFALDVAVQMTEFFEKYFDIDYPLPKQDIVGVPQHSSAAMENWGLIIVKEAFMLYKKGVTTAQLRYFVGRIVAHELAHMWAGNIVSPLWWDDVWLNEAFTTYFEQAAMKAVLPEWMRSELFTIDNTLYALILDGDVNAIPLSVNKNTPKELESIITYLHYEKGASIVRMLHFVLGDSTFKNAYNKFLKKYLYGSASREDLYREMTEQATTDCLNIDVKDFMDTWVMQRNYPLVTVTRNCDTSRSIQVTQARYLQDPSTAGNDTQSSPFGYRWNIPLTFASSSSPEQNPREHDVYWLYKEEHTKLIRVRIPLPNCTDPNGWILANLQQYGFYRVNYDIDNWRSLIQQLKRNHIVFSLYNRIQMMNDAWHLARASYIPLEIALETLDYLHREIYLGPWNAAEVEITKLQDYLELTPLGLPFQELMRERLSLPFNHVGLVNISEDHRTKLWQAKIANIACSYGLRACLDQAKILYGSLMQSQGRLQIATDFKETVYCAGVAEGSTPEWEFALQMFNSPGKNDHPDHTLKAMACSRNTEIQNRYLNALIADNTTFKADQAMTALKYMITAEEGRNVTWDFVKTHYPELQIVSNTTFECKALLKGLTSHFNRESDIAEVRWFREQYCDTFNITDFETKVVAPIQEKVNWYQTNSQVVRAWLIKNGMIEN